MFAFQDLYEDILQRKPQIENVNKDGGRFMKEAKVGCAVVVWLCFGEVDSRVHSHHHHRHAGVVGVFLCDCDRACFVIMGKISSATAPPSLLFTNKVV